MTDGWLFILWLLTMTACESAPAAPFCPPAIAPPPAKYLVLIPQYSCEVPDDRRIGVLICKGGLEPENCEEIAP